MSFRVPRVVELPWGYRIEVRREAPKEDCWGEFDPDERVIRVHPELSLAAARGTFLHEFKHALVDYELWVAQHVPVAYPDGAHEEPPDEGEREPAA